MLNLNTTHSLTKDHSLPGLPVLVDLNWFGRTLGAENGGIVPSRSASVTFNDDREVML